MCGLALDPVIVSSMGEVSYSAFSSSFELLILRPFLAISFVLSFISLGWFLAWKLVLVHVPLVQEIFGLNKKPSRPKPPTRRLSRYYKSIDAINSAPAASSSSSSLE